MKIVKLVVALTLALLVPVASAADGLVSVKSPYSAKETMNRLEELVKKRGLKVFARIDHAAGAASIGKSLRPTELLIFGNPQGGTPFMECAQSAGIDLPLKALVWEDASSQVWLSYNAPAFRQVACWRLDTRLKYSPIARCVSVRTCRDRYA